MSDKPLTREKRTNQIRVKCTDEEKLRWLNGTDPGELSRRVRELLNGVFPKPTTRPQ